MPITILKPKEGFSQRHNTNPKPSRYLQGLLDIPNNLARSKTSLPLIREDVLKFQNSSVKPNDPLLKYAMRISYDAFRLPETQKMLHLNDVFQQELPIWKSSPALPWTRYGYKTKQEIRDDPDAVRQIRWFWHRIKAGEKMHAPDCCAFARSHICDKGESKVRAVWGYPASVTFGEAVFALPLIRAYQKYKSPIAYGYETAIGGTKRIFNEFCKYPWKSAVDFKNFDKTVPGFLIEHAFNVLAMNIDFVNYQGHGVADARRMVTMWQYLQDYFIHTPIRLADGTRFRKHSGVASGSYFTQLIDSVVNHTLMVWICLKQTGRPPFDIKVLGDDSIMASHLRIDLDDADQLVGTIGMMINVAKSNVSRNVGNLKFLGFKINQGQPSKEHHEWLAALAFPETPDTSWDSVATRALGLLYACSAVDTRFDNICRNIIKAKDFTITIDRSLARYLRHQGIEPRELSTNLPNTLDFIGRLKLLQ